MWRGSGVRENAGGSDQRKEVTQRAKFDLSDQTPKSNPKRGFRLLQRGLPRRRDQQRWMVGMTRHLRGVASHCQCGAGGRLTQDAGPRTAARVRTRRLCVRWTVPPTTHPGPRLAPPAKPGSGPERAPARARAVTPPPKPAWPNCRRTRRGANRGQPGLMRA